MKGLEGFDLIAHHIVAVKNLGGADRLFGGTDRLFGGTMLGAGWTKPAQATRYYRRVPPAW